MSQENVELARRLFPDGQDLAATFASPEARDTMRATFEPLVQPNFETVGDPGYQMLLGDPNAVSEDPTQLTGFVGIEGFLAIFSEWLSGWESWVLAPTRFIDVDEDRVLVLADVSGRSKAQQVELTIQIANVMTFGSNGRLRRLQLFLRAEDALEAAGLSE